MHTTEHTSEGGTFVVYRNSIGIPPTQWIVVAVHHFGPAFSAAEFIPPRQTRARICRICELTSPATSFRTSAHLIPTALGNRTLFAFEECDLCNSQFGELGDNEIVNFLAPFRTITGVRGRRGIATLKIGNSRVANVNVNSALSTVTSNIVAKTTKPDVGFTDLHIDGYVNPYEITRALARMAIHVMNPNLEGVKPARDLLRGESSAPSLYWIFYSGHASEGGYLRVLRYPDLSRNWYVVELMACSLALFLPLPAGDWTLGQDARLWASLLGHGTGLRRHAYISGAGPVVPGRVPFTTTIRLVDPGLHRDITAVSPPPLAR